VAHSWTHIDHCHLHFDFEELLMITAIIIDSREPEWVQELTFGGIPTTVSMLDAGDLMAVTDDNCTLVIERKTPDDFLNTLRDDRLFPQIAGLTRARMQNLASGQMLTWPYLVITDSFLVGPNGKVITNRGETGWGHTAIEGALLTVQEMGVFVAHCAGDTDYEAFVLALGRRKRNPNIQILPARPPKQLGREFAVLDSLGIGADRATVLFNQLNTLECILNLINSDVPNIPGLTRSDYKKVQLTMQKEHPTNGH
jgi:ERCC4 domain-containing protein